VTFEDYFIKKVSENLPNTDFLTSSDLIQFGVAKSQSTLNRWRAQKIGPPFFVLSPGQIRYEKSSFLAWLQSRQQLTFDFMKNTPNKKSAS
jgi:hypothetical protein